LLKLLIPSFLIISLSLFSSDPVISFNELIKKDLKFTQDTFMSSDTFKSTGKIFQNKDFIEIEINSPGREKYIIRDKVIELFDYDFNQSQIFELDKDNMVLINFLLNGINNDDITDLSKNSFSIQNNNNGFYITLLSKNKFSIGYNDNLNYKNLITFETLN
jgi:hypothetical protein